MVSLQVEISLIQHLHTQNYHIRKKRIGLVVLEQAPAIPNEIILQNRNAQMPAKSHQIHWISQDLKSNV